MIQLLTLAAFLATPGLSAPDCYGRANALYAAEAFGDAGAEFEANAALEACAPARARLLVSAGEAYRAEAKQSGDARWYCRARDAYESARATTQRRRLVDAAIAGAAAVAQKCPRPADQPPKAAATPAAGEDEVDDFPTGWVIVGSLGAAAVIATALVLATPEPEVQVKHRVRVLPLE